MPARSPLFLLFSGLLQGAVEKATIRARGRQLKRVRFVVGDITEPGPGGPYDAIVSRLVLMYVSDPAAC